MKRRRAQSAALCDQCGAKLARRSIHPRSYVCVNPSCAPLRAVEWDRAWEEMLPELWEATGRLLQMPRDPRIPPHCYVPAFRVSQMMNLVYGIEMEQCAFYAAGLQAQLAWHATKSIYRFDPDLREALWATPIKGAIPVESLTRLPVWCAYVDAPISLAAIERCNNPECNIEHGPPAAAGFWICTDAIPLDSAEEGFQPVVRILFDQNHDDFAREYLPGANLPIDLAIRPGATVEQALNEANEVMVHNIEAAQVAGAIFDDHYVNMRAEFTPQIIDTVSRTLSLALYLCADNVDVPKRTEPLPSRVVHLKGRPVAAAARVSIVRCGATIGPQLRHAREERLRFEGGAGTVAPHIRSAHWHAFWTGPRAGPRSLVVHWLPPIPVNVDGPTPTTVHPVQG